MDSTTPSLTFPELNNSQRQQLLAEGALVSCYQVFQTIPDPRKGRGKRYELAYLLTCLVAALLCNRNSTLAAAEWCRDHQDLLAKLFGPRKFYCPSDSLYRQLLPLLDAKQVEAALFDWISATLVSKPDEAIALDGKTVRGARTDEHKAPHLLSFCTHESQETLLQIRVEAKTNEIPVAKAALPYLPIAGRVCTADALHTNLPFWKLVKKLGGDPLLIVKGNSPDLHEDLAFYFTDSEASFEEATTIDFQKGRKEVRRIQVTTERNEYLQTVLPGVAQCAKLERTVTTKKTGHTGVEVVYLVTTRSPAQASPERLLQLVRGHWCIENRSHDVRDVTFLEDRSKLRSGNAPQIMAALRNLAITLIHRQGSSQIAATRRSREKSSGTRPPFVAWLRGRLRKVHRRLTEFSSLW